MRKGQKKAAACFDIEKVAGQYAEYTGKPLAGRLKLKGWKTEGRGRRTEAEKIRRGSEWEENWMWREPIQLMACRYV